MFSLDSSAQDGEETDLVKETQAALEEWEGYAEVLSTYKGLSQYCRDNKFRDNVIITLNNIHHYDSLVLNKVNDKHTTKDILEFEHKYSAGNFRSHLKKECKERREVEKSKRDGSGAFGADSYEAQKLIVETEVSRYINHVNKVVVHIEHDLKKADL